MPLELYHLSPGHLIRRLQQIATGIFLDEVDDAVTPIQFAVLIAIRAFPESDIKGLARQVALDRSTIGTVVRRMVREGLVDLVPNDKDRRALRIRLTEAGRVLLSRVEPGVEDVQIRILSPLIERERPIFVGYLQRLVEANHGYSRSTADGATPGLPIAAYPGHLIRRLRQSCDGMFLKFTEPFGITPVQFSTLAIAAHYPGIDNRRLANLTALDQATLGEVVRRLDARGWIAIETSQADRRAKALRVTDAGRALLAKMQPVVETIEAEMMRALTRSEAGAFINMIVKILEKNNEESRAPYRDIRGA